MSARPVTQHEGVLGAVKHSVRRKLMLVVLATTAVALVLMGVSMLVYDLRTYHQAGVNDLFSQAELIGQASAPALEFDDRKVAGENLKLLTLRPRVAAAAIYTANGSLFATYARADVTEPNFPPLPGREGYRIEGSELVLFKRIEKDNEILGTIYFRAHYELIGRLFSYLMIMGGVMVISLSAAALMTAWLQGTLTDPILAITRVARQVMARRDFSLRVEKTTEDEIGYLVDTFNSMLAEIGKRAQALEESNRILEHEMEERRLAQDALLAADRRKDEFLATLAHELRNPLAPLRNALEIIRTGDHDAGAVHSARAMMERQLRQLVHLVNDLLDVSRITTGKMALKIARAELQAVIENVLETVGPLIEARKHKLTVLAPPGPVYLMADSTRLAQVFVNLLNNAAKFTGVGGSITLEAAQEDGVLAVTVTDTGIGIPADMLGAVFDLFAQVDRSLEREQAGLGVGLSLARHLVELHGGTIAARSAGLGQGSSFMVRLPGLVAPAATNLARIDSVGCDSGAARHRVLLADDNVDFAESLALILKAIGHAVYVAQDGVEALDAADRFAPDFAFLDIGLPRLNGYDLARRLREIPAMRHCVLVAVTGWGQEEDKRRAREAGFDHHLVKPVEPDQILHLLATFCRAT